MQDISQCSFVILLILVELAVACTHMDYTSFASFFERNEVFA